MPSNTDLRKKADELAKALGLEIKTEGLNNEKLAALVSDLKAKKKDADTQTAADDAEAKAIEAGNKAADKAKAVKKPPFYVMPGKAITSKRGILATERGAKVEDYAEIKASDLAGKEEALNAFVESGHIGKA